MAHVFFDSGYVPCGFLIVPKGGNPYQEDSTLLVQSDWDYPGVASRMGYVPCACEETDGTIDCKHKSATQMISEAYDFIREREGQEFAELDDYLTPRV